MEKVNRLGWAAGMAVRSFGLTIGVRTNAPEVLGQVVPLLPPGATPVDEDYVGRLYSVFVGKQRQANVRAFHLVYSGQDRIARSMELGQALETLETDVKMYVAESAHRRIFVHAGVVGWRGKAILLPGRTFTGKSTLVEALVRAGAEYYSDEYAVLDAAGRVHPYPKSIAIRDPETHRGMPRSVEEMGGKVGSAPIPVGLVVATRYRAGAGFRPRRISPGQVLLELLGNTIPARRATRRALSVLQRVAVQATALRGTRGEAAEVAETLLARVAG